jgi:NAD-dependent dihydropyrimidine dehydrogenase PreA subunit
MTGKTYLVPNPPLPNRAIEFYASICNGCDMCIEVCRNDVLMPNPVDKMPPIVVYPEECWYCGMCVEECPLPGSISMHHPLRQTLAVRWVRKDTDQEFRLEMKDPPPPNTRPASGHKYRPLIDGRVMRARGVVKSDPSDAK